VKRYAIMDGHGWPYGETERANGPWVRFEDAAAEIHRLNNLLTQVTLERDALKRSAHETSDEPTPAMIEAGKDERMRCFDEPLLDVGTALARIYKVMRKAAGSPVEPP
jgi:hypothetical protein